MPILLLTARDVSEGIVRGLDADDYLTKPEVSFSESGTAFGNRGK